MELLLPCGVLGYLDRDLGQGYAVCRCVAFWEDGSKGVYAFTVFVVYGGAGPCDVFYGNGRTFPIGFGRTFPCGLGRTFPVGGLQGVYRYFVLCLICGQGNGMRFGFFVRFRLWCRFRFLFCLDRKSVV